LRAPERGVRELEASTLMMLSIAETVRDGERVRDFSFAREASAAESERSSLGADGWLPVRHLAAARFSYAAALRRQSYDPAGAPTPTDPAQGWQHGKDHAIEAWELLRLQDWCSATPPTRSKGFGRLHGDLANARVCWRGTETTCRRSRETRR
jgi:hypothetical protein